MLTPLKHLFQPKLKSLNTISIDHKAIFHNLQVMQELQPHCEIRPVLKSNAYGHGLELVSKILRHSDIRYICVDSIPEYQVVRKHARKPSLLIWETLPANYKYLDPKRATICVYNTATLQALIDTKKKRKIHLFLNTGMNREGIQLHDLWWFLELLHWSRIELEWVMSHLANADELDSSMCDTQIANFKQMDALISQYGYTPRYKHIQNSAGIAKISDPHFNACRSGLACYGYSPLWVDDPYTQRYADLRPALQVSSTIVALQRISQWDIVSYGGRFVAPQDMVVATIPFGYTEGLSRSLRDQRSVSRGDQQLPVLGTICMNLCIIDVTGTDIKIWDTVQVISSDPQADNSILSFATKSGTIPYEVLVNLDTKARRIVV